MNITITINAKHLLIAAIGLASVAILTTGSNRAVSGAKVGTTLRAQKLELVDPNGATRSELSASDDGFRMFCYDGKGKTAFTITARDLSDGKSTVSMNLLSKESSVVLTTIDGGAVEIVSANGQKSVLKPASK